MKHPMLRLFERVAIRLGTLIGFSPPPRIAKVEQDADKIMITFNQDAHKKHNETIGSWPIRHYSLLVQFDPLDESEAVDEDDPDGAFTAAEAYTKRIRIESVAEPYRLNLPIGHRFYFRVAAVHDVDPRPNIDVLVRGIFCRKSEKIVVKPAPGSPRDVVVLDKAVGRTASQVAWGAAPGAASYIAEMVNAQSAVLGRAYIIEAHMQENSHGGKTPRIQFGNAEVAAEVAAARLLEEVLPADNEGAAEVEFHFHTPFVANHQLATATDLTPRGERSSSTAHKAFKVRCAVPYAMKPDDADAAPGRVLIRFDGMNQEICSVIEAAAANNRVLILKRTKLDLGHMDSSADERFEPGATGHAQAPAGAMPNIPGAQAAPVGAMPVLPPGVQAPHGAIAMLSPEMVATCDNQTRQLLLASHSAQLFVPAAGPPALPSAATPMPVLPPELMASARKLDIHLEAPPPEPEPEPPKGKKK